MKRLLLLFVLSFGIYPAFGQAPPTVAEIKQEAKVEAKEEAKVEATAEIKEQITSPVGAFVWTAIILGIVSNVGLRWQGDISSWISDVKDAKEHDKPRPAFDWQVFLGQTVLGLVSGIVTGAGTGFVGSNIAI